MASEAQNGPIVVHVVGWTTCGYWAKTSNVVSAMAQLYPQLIQADIQEVENRDAFRQWIAANKDDNTARLGEAAGAHKSSPFVWIGDDEWVGGCDDTLAFIKRFVAQQSGPASARTAPQAQALPAPVDAGHAFDYDLVVIGGGSGGLACSKEAARLGARVALLDFVKPSPAGASWGLGGTCVNVGCIPKKLFHQASLLGEGARDAAFFGWAAGQQQHAWTTMVDNVQDYIRGLNFKYRTSLRDANVTYMNKLGRFTGPNELECTDKKGRTSSVTAARFVIAVGGRPRPLSCPGGEHAISSDDVFSLAEAPGKTLVVGASYVALECAGALNGLGVDVTVMVRSILLRGFDQDIAERIGAYMEHEGTKFLRGAVPTSIEKQADGRLLVSWDGGQDTFDTVLAAIGRDADTAGLNLEAAGVESNSSGKFDCQDETTNVPHIFAIGDVVQGKPELTPVAIQAGQTLARRLFDGSTEAMDYERVPTAVFTPLEYGCCGLSQEDAEARFGDDLEVFISFWTPLEWTLNEGREADQCHSKLLVQKSTDVVVGFHYLGPNAGEVTQGFGTAMKMGATKADFDATVGIHPTTAENFNTLTVTQASGEDAAAGGC